MSINEETLLSFLVSNSIHGVVRIEFNCFELVSIGLTASETLNAKSLLIEKGVIERGSNNRFKINSYNDMNFLKSA